MKEYYVSYMCVFSTTVYAENEEEAADIAENECYYDVDGEPYIKLLRDNVPLEEYDF